MHPTLMCQKVWEHRADLGLAHDGDGDRVLLCDEHGALIDGDDVMAIAGLEMLAQGTLADYRTSNKMFYTQPLYQCDGYVFNMFKALDRGDFSEVRKTFPPP